MQLLLGKTAVLSRPYDVQARRVAQQNVCPLAIGSATHLHAMPPLPSRSLRALPKQTARKVYRGIVCSAATKVEKLVVQPVKVIEGHVKLPGSKSLSNRILLLAALAEGTTTVENILVSRAFISPNDQAFYIKNLTQNSLNISLFSTSLSVPVGSNNFRFNINK